MVNRFTRRGKGERWTTEQLDATLGKLTGKKMRDAPHFKTGEGKAIAVVDTDTRTTAAHGAFKARAAAAATVQLYPLVGLCRAAGLPEPVPEYVFHPVRKWRFDYGWPAHLIAVEVEGGVWTQGRHTRGQGFLDDMDKYNAAAVLNWRVLRYPPDKLTDALPALQTLFGLVK